MSETVSKVPPFVTEKPKKPRSDAQIATTKKALAVLKERREALRKEEEAELAKAQEPAQKEAVLEQKMREKAIKQKRLPPKVDYVTMDNLRQFKDEFAALIPKIKEPEIVTPVIKEVIKEVPVAPAAPVVPAQVVVEKPKLVGFDFIDSIYNRRR